MSRAFWAALSGLDSVWLHETQGDALGWKNKAALLGLEALHHLAAPHHRVAGPRKLCCLMMRRVLALSIQVATLPCINLHSGCHDYHRHP